MRKIFTLLLLVAGFAATAQQYNNEWIQYGQTYYKFKVANDGVYRIPQSLLDANGLGGVQVQFLELWRNGQKVPFYPSVSSGVLPSGGYLEFWGERNDGKPDKDLYRNPAYQHTTKYSLQTDTAIYFLSVNTNQSGFRYKDVFNNVTGHGLTAEPYFMHTVGNYYKGAAPNLGFASPIGGVYVYSSSYDVGEFFSSGDIYPSGPVTTPQPNLKVYSGGPASTLKFGATGNAPNTRHIKVRVNGVEVKDTVMDYFNDLVTTAPVNTSDISSGTAAVQFTNTSTNSTDRMQVSFYELTYPRTFDFNGLSNFSFELPHKAGGYFLQITNFNAGSSVQPVLYDKKNGDRFVGVVSGGQVQVALPDNGASRQLVLVSEEAANITTVTQLTPRTFINYKQLANQNSVDYLIVSNSALYTGTRGNNPVVDYKNYRESSAGGSHKVLIADIDELVDQFAFGIKKHPLSIRNLIRYARASFTRPIGDVFLIGRGVNYSEYQYASRNPTLPNTSLIEQLNLVPTFGWPGSDNLLSAEDLTEPAPSTPIGRLSVVSGREIEDYLEKIKEYDLAQQNAPNTIAGRSWMKNVVHVTGSSDPYLGVVLCNYMEIYSRIIQDTLFGANVTTFCKVSTNPVEQISGERLSQKFAEGISFLTYFGHSSATTLEFNIDDPQNYDNAGKYPVFLVNGCKAGDFFTFYPQRLSANETLSEKFTLAKQRGAIGFVASTHFGIVNYLNLYLTSFYDIVTTDDYGKSLGETMRDALKDMLLATGTYDFYSRIHAEQMTLHGDPALLINAQPKPDYVIEDQTVKVTPSFISLAESSFNVKVKLVNLGRAYSDSVRFEVKRQYPDGTTGILYNKMIPRLRYADSIELTVPIVAIRDKGLNRIVATIDADNAVDEITETNNSITKEFYIFEEEARPVYPYKFAIINNPSQKLYASTANPLSKFKTYVMEIDTTELFNSSLKVSKSVSSVGGILEFSPEVTYKDSVVYYWRVAQVPTDNGEYHWLNSSFRFVNANVDGFGQSHYFQHLQSATEHISLTDSLKWAFGTTKHIAFFMSGVYPTSSDQGSAYRVTLDDNVIMGAGCAFNELIINVVDPVTFQPWVNQYAGNSGLYGSHGCGTDLGRKYNFMFYHTNAATRKQAMDFLDIIPNGYYVMIRNNSSAERPSTSDPLNVYVDAWKADTTLYAGNSLYHKLFYAGFYELDSFYVPRSFTFIYKKGDASYRPRYQYSKGPNDRISLSAECIIPDTVGIITSPKFGPARQWFEVKWDGVSVENPSNDNPVVDVVGVDKNNIETILYQLNKSTPVLDVSSVSVEQYPYMFLRMRNIDSVTLSPYQLKYWRIHYEPQPEGAIAPNLYLVMKDTFDLGDSLRFGVAFKNVSKQSFDSIAVKATILDQNNNTHVVYLGKQKPIITGDTVTVNFTLGTVDYSGSNTLFIDFNHDNDQPEYEHFNNFLYHGFYVHPDKTNPLLDVTFDGVHILNRDIVSAKPHIQIKLKDESKFMLLTDTTLGNVQVRYPNGTLRTYHYDSDTLRFTPAASGSDNTATIDFTPEFTNQINPDGDEYELIVKGKDKSGNKAGDLAYRVAFKVIAKPMISNILNYPNPFSTSTAFVFSITGSEVPQNIRIQILTVTGKIIREITMNELGPLHIGRNITEFKWDGTDQYGQKLGNGVYLYRVITSLDGKPMDKYKATGDNTDKFFNNGYGKMYLMR